MGWVNYPDFRFGTLDRGARVSPQVALRSLADCNNAFVETRGAVTRRPGMEDQGIDLDHPFICVPYYSEEQTYLLVITYGDFSLEWNDDVVSSESAVSSFFDDSGSTTTNTDLEAGTASTVSGLTSTKGRIYLYLVSEQDSEQGSISTGYVTQINWASHLNDYLYGPDHVIRRAQKTVSGFLAPDLSNYQHSWTTEQVKGIKYAQHSDELFLFIPDFPTVRIQRADSGFTNSLPTLKKPNTPYGFSALETTTEKARASNESTITAESWVLEVDAIEPELVRHISPPVNLLMTSATQMVAGDDFFTEEMKPCYFGYGQGRQSNSANDTNPSSWLYPGILGRVQTFRNSRVGNVIGLRGTCPSEIVPSSFFDGTSIYESNSTAIKVGEAEDKTSNLLQSYAGPWTRDKANDDSLEVTLSPSGSYIAGINKQEDGSGNPLPGSPHSLNQVSTVEMEFFYYIDSNSELGQVLVDNWSLDETAVGKIIEINQESGTNDFWYLYYIYNVTNTSGEYDFSSTLRFHVQEYLVVRQADGADQNRTASDISRASYFNSDDKVAIYSVKAPHVMMGCMGYDIDPKTASGQSTKATVYVNDPKFLPANLDKGNRPLKRAGVTASPGTYDAPLMAGGSIFFNEGIFRPTARISAVAYEGYWEKQPAHATAQNYVSYGSGGSSGFASCGEQHQGRLVVGGFGGAVEDVVAFSRSNQPSQMRVQLLDSADDPFSLQLGQSTEEQVSWIGKTQAGLVVGGRTGEYVVQGAPISALSVGYQRVSAVGGASAKPAYTDNEVVFLARDKRSLGGVRVAEASDQTLFSQRLSDIASQLFLKDVIGTGYVYSPYPIFFFLKDDGEVVTYTRDQGIGAFSRFSHANGTLMSVASAVRSSKVSDTLFFCVKRTIGSETKFRLERLNFSAHLDSQRCTSQYTVASYGSQSNVASITTTKLRFLSPWQGATVSVITVDANGDKVFRGDNFTVQSEDMGSGVTDYYVSLASLGLTTAPSKVIIGFNFNGTFAPATVTEVPGYMCSFTSGLLLGENLNGLSVTKGDVVAVSTTNTGSNSSGWLNVYNLGHFSRDEGPTFTLKGPFGSTVQSLSVEVDSED